MEIPADKKVLYPVYQQAAFAKKSSTDAAEAEVARLQNLLGSPEHGGITYTTKTYLYSEIQDHLVKV